MHQHQAIIPATSTLMHSISPINQAIIPATSASMHSIGISPTDPLPLTAAPHVHAVTTIHAMVIPTIIPI